jgi:lysozyme family protein
MATFEDSIDGVLKREGAGLRDNPTGYVNDPSDSGGETNWGIARNSNPDLPADFFTDPRTIANLSARGILIAKQRGVAVEVYRKKYWNSLYSDLSQPLANKFFDMRVNMGAKSACKIVQRGLCDIGKSVVVDGILGSATIKAMNGVDSGKLLAAIRVRQRSYYDAVIVAHPECEKFRQGWYVRAEQV